MMQEDVNHHHGGVQGRSSVAKTEPDTEEKPEDTAVGVSMDSVKIVADSLGIQGLPDDACREMSEEVTYRLRILAQNAQKFMYHGRRNKMMSEEVTYRLRIL